MVGRRRWFGTSGKLVKLSASPANAAAYQCSSQPTSNEGDDMEIDVAALELLSAGGGLAPCRPFTCVETKCNDFSCQRTCQRSEQSGM